MRRYTGTKSSKSEVCIESLYVEFREWALSDILSNPSYRASNYLTVSQQQDDIDHTVIATMHILLHYRESRY